MVLVAVAAAALVPCSASLAQADPTTSDHYRDLQWVAYLSANGITVDNPDEAGKLGRTICYMADHGYSVDEIEQFIKRSVADVTPIHTSMIAASAIRNYCPPASANTGA